METSGTRGLGPPDNATLRTTMESEREGSGSTGGQGPPDGADRVHERGEERTTERAQGTRGPGPAGGTNTRR